MDTQDIRDWFWALGEAEVWMKRGDACEIRTIQGPGIDRVSVITTIGADEVTLYPEGRRCRR